jgi:hypothetical protein
MLGANGLPLLTRTPPVCGARSADRFGLALVADAGLGIGGVVSSRRHGVSTFQLMALPGYLYPYAFPLTRSWNGNHLLLVSSFPHTRPKESV